MMDKNTDKIIIKDKKEFERKLELIKKDGADKLHIISDFDMTLTKPKIGEMTNSTYVLLNQGGYLGDEFMKNTEELYNFYRPIETSTDISKVEIAKKMDEWLDKYYTLLMKSGLKKNHFLDIIKKDKIILRDYAHDFMSISHERKIPMLVLSAGLGDLIQEYLNYKKEEYSNIHLISNFLKFDEEGNAVGHSKYLITAFNKNEAGIKNTPYYDLVSMRKNVILLGDTIGDSNMASGLEHDTVLKIAFLNTTEEKQEKQEAVFSQHYDAVIVNGTFKFVNDLMKEIK